MKHSGHLIVHLLSMCQEPLESATCGGLWNYKDLQHRIRAGSLCDKDS